MGSTHTLAPPASHLPLGAPATAPTRTAAPVRTDPGTQLAPGASPDPATGTHPELDAAGDSWAHVDAAQNGDNEAFGRLYDEYAQLVYRYVLFRVSDHCLAEDITSETFLRALRRIASVSYQGRDVAAWFITIAKNLILDHAKSSRTRLEVPTSEPADSPAARGNPQFGPEHQVLAEVTHRELWHCVRRLNPDQRECIRLRFITGMSVTETALAMHRNEGAIKALQHRAVRRLAQLLSAESS